jgi:hypothetical protein
MRARWNSSSPRKNRSRVDLRARVHLDLLAHEGANEHAVRRGQIGDRPDVVVPFEAGVGLGHGEGLARDGDELRFGKAASAAGRRPRMTTSAVIATGAPDAGTSCHTAARTRRVMTVWSMSSSALSPRRC